MRAKVFGFRSINMTDKETGRLIVGDSLFVGYPSNGVNGLETTKVFINSDMARANNFKPVVDGLVNIEYGPNGRLMAITNLNDK